MRIVFSTDQIYLHGGLEKVLSEKANYFADVFGYDVTILTTQQRGKTPCYSLSEKIKLVDIDVAYRREESYFHPANLKLLTSHLKKQRNIFARLKPDVIIVCNFAFDFYWIPFIKGTAVAYKEFHSSRYQLADVDSAASFAGTIKFKINNRIEAKYDKLILLNKDEANFCHSKNVVVIPNSVPLHDNLQARVIEKKILAAGRVAPVKGFDSLIDAWEIVVKKHPDWCLDIYGDTYLDTRKDLENVIRKKDIQDSLKFKGTVSNMVSTMTDYSMFVMSSKTECFPMVLLEALSVGLPVVSFNCPTGPRNIITDKADGLLAKDQDIADLAEKIILLIENEELRKKMSNNGKLNSQRFSNHAVMQRWRNLFKSVKR